MKRMAWLAWFFIGVLATTAAIALIITLVPMREKQTIIFEYQTPMRPNPLMGFAPWATEHPEEITVPFSLVYIDMTWREIEPVEGVFDFAAFEERTRLNDWRVQNKRFVFRFLLDVPRKEEHIDIPDWLYEKIAGDGDIYMTSYGKGFSPNYANPTLITAHQKAIQAIADRYDGARVFPFIELGSLGHWGEWHIKSGEGLLPIPPASVRDVYIQHYLNSFTNSKFLTRRPFAASELHDLGLFNDMFGSQKSTKIWMDWIQNGGEYDQTGEPNGLVPMPSAYLSAPVGGEISGSTPASELFIEGLPELITQFEESHATFIGPGGYDNPDNDPIIHNGQLKLYDNLGYQFQVTSVEIPKTVRFGDAFKGKLTLKNTGIAPFYFPWPVQFHVENSSTGANLDVQINPDLPSIQPGRSIDIPFSVPITDFEDGTIAMDFSIIDPQTGQPAIFFGNLPEDLKPDEPERIMIGKVTLDRPLKPWLERLNATLQLLFTNSPNGTNY